jgi:DNA-binding NarL/FixJ family response regulator
VRVRVIGLLAPTPLAAEGLHGALAEVAAAEGWQLAVMDAFDPADAYVLQAGDAAGLAVLPADRPAVVVGAAPRALLFEPATAARAWLGAGVSPAQLRVALAAVLEGLSVRDADSAAATGAISIDPIEHEPLTPRELEVYELLAKGLSNRDIGGVLGISAHTAKYHVAQILAKVGAATRAEAVHIGLRQGLIGL